MWVFLQLFYAALLSPRGSKADESSPGSERLARREYVGWNKKWVNKSRGLMNDLYGCIWISVIDQSYKHCLATDLTISQGWPLIVLQVVADPTSLANSQGRSNHIFFSSFSTGSTFSIHLHPRRFRHAMQQHAYSLRYVGRVTCSKPQVEALPPELELTVTKSSPKSLMSCIQRLQAPPVLRAG